MVTNNKLKESDLADKKQFPEVVLNRDNKPMSIKEFETHCKWALPKESSVTI